MMKLNIFWPLHHMSDGGKTITDAIILQLQNAHFSFPNVETEHFLATALYV
jgi:hypothetical protein